MARKIDSHIKFLSNRSKATENVNTLKSVGKNMSDSSDTEIANMGEELKSSADTLNNAITNQIIAKAAAKSATAKLRRERKNACKTFNLVAKKVEQKYPNNTTQWKFLGFKNTSATAHEQKIPERIITGSMIQGEFPKQCVIEFAAVVNADAYTVEITKDDPSDDTKYILVINPRMIFTTHKIAFIVPDDYLDENIWAKVTSHNAAGQSPASTPIGGKKIF